MVTFTDNDTLRFTSNYSTAIAEMTRAMTDLRGSIKKSDPSSGLIEAAWRYGINPWGLRVTAQFRKNNDGTISVTVKGGFKDAFTTVKAPREKAAAVLERFTTLIKSRITADTNTLPSDEAFQDQNHLTILSPPHLGDGITPHRGKNKTATLLLAFFLGGLGIHRLYLGSWGIGFLYLLMLTVPGLGVIISTIEAVRILLMSVEKFDDQYNLRRVYAFTF